MTTASTRLARAVAWAGVAWAGVALAACSAGPGTSRATVATCYAFAVQALDRHVTVTAVPPACRGLNHEQINLAIDRAIHEVAGPHRKAIARRLDHKEAAYLSYLVTVVPPHVAPPPAAAPSGPSSRLPLDIAALAAWAVTVAAGARLLAGWIAHGGLRRGRARVAGMPRAVIAGHFTLALTGLGVWIGFLVTGLAALAWTAVAVVLSVAGLGMATLAGGLPEWGQAAAATAGPVADLMSAGPAIAGPAIAGPAIAGPAAAGPAIAGPAADLASAAPAAADPVSAATEPERTAAIGVPAGAPLAFIALHGALAAATILLVVLAAIGTG
jgi:manganese efflux pump family protein